MIETVLDASAVLALLKDEPGANEIETALNGAAISTVNLVEVRAKLLSGGMTEAAVTEALDNLNMQVVAFDEDQALFAGQIREPARLLGLSLADCACISLAHASGCPVLTCDRGWSKAGFGVAVRVVR